MNTTNLDKARDLIATTQLLKQQEKAEWTQHLASMNDQQVESLIAFLTPKVQAAPVQVTAPVVTPAPVPQPAQKEPAPTSLEKVMASVVAAHVETPSLQPTTTAAPAAQAAPQPAPRPIAQPPQAPKSQQTPTGKMAQPKLAEYTDQLIQTSLTSHLSQPQDFAKLSTPSIHYTHPEKVFAAIYQRIADMAKSQPTWTIVQNLEASPLYQAYIDTGHLLLNDENADTSRFDMSKDEFEAFADFRRNLKAIGG